MDGRLIKLCTKEVRDRIVVAGIDKPEVRTSSYAS
jgi:hypothetical protein